MAAVAAIPNPLVTDTTTGQQTLLFNLTTDNQLALQTRLPNSKDPLDAPSLPKGFLVNPSSFAVLRYDDLINVYGIIDTGTTDKKKNKILQIYVISPVFRPLTYYPSLTSLAACGDGIDQGWIYYLNGTDNPYISEIALGPTVSANDYTTATPVNTSYLAACYDWNTQKRLTFYQTDDNISYLDADGPNVDSVNNTDDAMDSSPLAVCVIPDASGTGTNICLYFVNGHHKLQRVTYDGSKWTKSTTDSMNKALKVSDGTQMAVVADPAAKVNRLFYLQNGQESNGYVSWSDPFVQTD